MPFPMLESLAGQRVFVTGATGFIGRRLVAGLVANEARVTALLRSRHGGAHFRRMGLDVVVGSLSDPEALSAALSGRSVVVHLAYDVRGSAETNLKTFNTLYDAAVKTGVGRFIHVSSIVVYNGWPSSEIDEDSPANGTGGSPYRQAKLAMEQRLISGDIPVAILQPTLVYGPGSALWTDALAQQLLSGTVVLPEPEGQCNAVFVDDLVQAILRATALPDLGRERFIISGAEPVSWSGLLDGYAASLGVGKIRHEPIETLQERLGPEPTTDIPPAGPSVAAKVSALGRRVLGRERFEALVRAARRRVAKPEGDVYPDRYMTELYSSSGVCRIGRARDRLGYDPEYTLDKGLAATSGYLNKRYATDIQNRKQQG